MLYFPLRGVFSAATALLALAALLWVLFSYPALVFLAAPALLWIVGKLAPSPPRSFADGASVLPLPRSRGN